jgi:hypothetical protein
MGAVGAFILAGLHGRLTWPLIKGAMTGTMRLTAMVVFILIGSRVFSLVFQGVEGGRWIEHMLAQLPGGQLGFLIAVNIFIFFLAFFLDFFEIAFIILPFLAPVADKMGINMIWFGVMICVNMQTSFMHPPFGFALFYLRGISDTLFKNKALPRPCCRATSTGARCRGWCCSSCWSPSWWRSRRPSPRSSTRKRRSTSTRRPSSCSRWAVAAAARPGRGLSARRRLRRQARHQRRWRVEQRRRDGGGASRARAGPDEEALT